MLGNYLSPLALGFAAFRMGLALVWLFALWRLWRRPRPGLALLTVVGAHLAAWAAYTWPLQRPYAMADGSDRAFYVGMAASTALGNSPFEHTQVGFPSPEPFWNFTVAALAFFDPDRVATVYGLLTPLSLLAMAAAVYFALRDRAEDSDADRWTRVLLAAAVLGLSSLSMHPRPPSPPFWAANFMLKPNHAMGLALSVAAVGTLAEARLRALRLAALLGLLAWVFLLDWGYVVPALGLGLLFQGRLRSDLRGLVLAVLGSAVVAAPFVRHLLRGYAPTGAHGASHHMWFDPRSLSLALPHWSTLDLGLLFVLALAGAFALKASATRRDRALLGLVVSAFGTWLLSVPAALVGVSPEPDELHYFLRCAAGLAAGAALATGARHLELVRGLAQGQGHVLALAVILPVSFPVYWDPVQMDRYYPLSLTPLKAKSLAYADWVKANTRPDAVFVAGSTVASWIPALSGRRVLLNEAGPLKPPDFAERKQVEELLLTSTDAAAVQAAASRYGITHVAIDTALQNAYGAGSFDELGRAPVFRTVHQSTAVRILEIKP